jgi:tetratricopeptide (TPR) repeat protein
MAKQRSLIGLALLVFLLPAVGCGGSKKTSSGGSSFTSQYEAALELTYPAERARELCRVAIHQYQGKDAGGARKSLSEAAKACEKVDEPLARSDVYAHLASTYALVGNRLDAKRALRTAREASEKIESPESRARAVCYIAEVQGVRLDSQEDALDSLDQCEELAEDLEDLAGKTAVLASISKTYSLLKLKDDSQRVEKLALQSAQALEDPRERTDAITTVAAAQISARKIKSGRATLELAIISSEAIDNKYGRVFAMAEIAKGLSKSGQPTVTHALLKQAEQLAEQIPEPDLKQQALDLVYKLARELPKPKK